MQKMTSHSKSAWIENFHFRKEKGLYHVNAFNVFLEGKEVIDRLDQRSRKTCNREQRQNFPFDRRRSSS